jgi:phospho-N-acetylmuramoyl-pentapeptide-transferase
VSTQIIYFFVAFILTAIFGKIIIPILKKLKVGQNERTDGPRSHLRKQGTPTMGGIMMILTIIILSIVAGSIIGFKEILPVCLASIGFGIIGFIDDLKKLVLKNTEGLNPKLKMFGLLIIATIYTVYLTHYLNIGTEILIPFTNYTLNMPVWIFIPFTILVMLSATNAVNLTDGVDGLVPTVLAIITGTLSVIGFKLGYNGISIFASIVSGSCVGFLIYNVYKAKVIMGDTGSLLLGGVISSIAIYIKNPFILVIIAIVPIIETLSVILQVISFRFTGKRMFRMAPLHHHFELSGWRENKVVVIFGLITLIACIIGVIAV